MSSLNFHVLFCRLVHKVSNKFPVEIDPEFNYRAYFDAKADEAEAKAHAFAAAADLLAENGYIDSVDPSAALSEVVNFQSV